MDLNLSAETGLSAGPVQMEVARSFLDPYLVLHRVARRAGLVTGYRPMPFPEFASLNPHAWAGKYARPQPCLDEESPREPPRGSWPTNRVSSVTVVSRG